MSSVLKRKLCETKVEKTITEYEMIKMVNDSFPEDTLFGLNDLQRIKLFKLVYWLSQKTPENSQERTSK